MGSYQSRPSDAAIQEELMERLHALHVKASETSYNEKDGYIHIDNSTPNVAHQSDVSAAAISKWEKELLEDPKVCPQMRYGPQY